MKISSRRLRQNSTSCVAHAIALEDSSHDKHTRALRAGSNAGFRRRVSKALSLQREATAWFKKGGPVAGTRKIRSEASEALLSYWLSTDREERNKFLGESWRLAKRALESFNESEDLSEYVKTFNRFSFAVASSIEHEQNLRARVRKIQDGVEHGRRAVAAARDLGDTLELTKALMRAAIFLDALADDLSDKNKQVELRRDSRRLWDEALSTSREIALREMTHPLHGFQIADPRENLKLYKEALGVVAPRKDRFAIGRLMEFSAKMTYYAAESNAGGDPTIMMKMHKQALRYAEKAAKHFDTINRTSPSGGVLWVHSPYAEHFNRLAAYEMDPEKRTAIEEKSLRSTDELLKLAVKKGSPRVMFYAFYTSSKARVVVAIKESNRRRRRNLLRRALSDSIQANQVTSQVFGPMSWNLAVGIRGIANIQDHLSKAEGDSQEGTRILLDAIHNQEKSLKISIAFLRAFEVSGLQYNTERIGRLYTELGDMLLRLARISGAPSDTRKAASAYITGAEWSERTPRYERSAECFWKAAECYDQLQAYSIASDHFKTASKLYSKFGQLTPSLNRFAEDYCRYLESWSNIEAARSQHVRRQFASAANSFRAAANLQRSTSRWNMLAPYYFALSELEAGEDLSLKGEHKSSEETFRKAATMFQDAKTLLKERLFQIEQVDEKSAAERLSRSSRDTFCWARASLERAAMAEKSHDYQTSFEEYRLASQKLQEIVSTSEQEADRREASFLDYLSKARQSVSMSETQDSIEHLERALLLFRKASALGPDAKSVKLANGHAAFCEATIHSRKFAETLDREYHDMASKQLELAYEIFTEAGFKIAAHHAKARRLLLNASLLLSSAEKEPTKSKKDEFYKLADLTVQESQTEFVRAKQPVGREQSRRLLQRTRTQAVASSQLSEIMRGLVSLSGNTVLYSPAQGVERAVGIERFEHADIETNLNNLARVAGSRDEFEFEIEISNTGKQSVRLLGLDGAVPAGTEIIQGPDGWKAEKNSLTHSSRVLSPTKTERLRIVVRPSGEGLLAICPRVVFIDESGWRLERSVRPKILATSRIIEYLAHSFINDNTRHLPLERCGWRSMMEVVKELKIPRSHVYGARRYGRVFGRQLDSLIRSSLVEFRIFPEERGRGGNITRVRIQMNNEDVRRYVDELSPANHADV